MEEKEDEKNGRRGRDRCAFRGPSSYPSTPSPAFAPPEPLPLARGRLSLEAISIVLPRLIQLRMVCTREKGVKLLWLHICIHFAVLYSLTCEYEYMCACLVGYVSMLVCSSLRLQLCLLVLLRACQSVNVQIHAPMNWPVIDSSEHLIIHSSAPADMQVRLSFGHTRSAIPRQDSRTYLGQRKSCWEGSGATADAIQVGASFPSWSLH